MDGFFALSIAAWNSGSVNGMGLSCGKGIKKREQASYLNPFANINYNMSGIDKAIRKIQDTSSPGAANGNSEPLLEMDPFIGRDIETKQHKYIIRRLISKGGMAKVYEAMDGDARFAIKITAPIRDSSDRTKDFVERFKREAQVLKMLDHPNIVKIYGGGWIHDNSTEIGDRLYLAMQYVEGESLYAIVSKKILPYTDTKQIMLGSCGGLSAAHNSMPEIIHRDVKPSNIIVRRNGGVHATIIDFGVAKLIDVPSLTIAGSWIGSLRYCSPEQLDSVKSVDHRTDIYGLGASLYFALTGTVPFMQTSMEELYDAICKTVPEPPSKRAPKLGIPPEIDDLVMSMLEKKPSRRPQSMDIVSDLLMRCTWDGMPPDH
jgi:serine/threonine-protein kinase